MNKAKTILVTGATDGIGLETAKALVLKGHNVIIHGRNQAKLDKVKPQLEALNNSATIETMLVDLSQLSLVNKAVEKLSQNLEKLDVLINNAGVFQLQDAKTVDGLDVRFAVNTIAPYMLTQALMPLLGRSGRVVNLSSAAQSSFNPDSIKTDLGLNSSDAYAQSKLALTMWSHDLGDSKKQSGPMIVSINPKSFLGSKMVHQAYGIAGGNLKDGADILVKAALSDEFSDAHGLYYDNDIARFAKPHSDVFNPQKQALLRENLNKLVASFQQK